MVTVKYENIMWESPTSDQIKVIDFGLSKYCRPGDKKTMSEGVGTIYTMAPQGAVFRRVFVLAFIILFVFLTLSFLFRFTRSTPGTMYVTAMSTCSIKKVPGYGYGTSSNTLLSTFIRHITS